MFLIVYFKIHGPKRRGSNTKRMSAEIEERIKEDQRKKDRQRQREDKMKGVHRKKRFERNESEELQRRIKRVRTCLLKIFFEEIDWVKVSCPVVYNISYLIRH